MKKKINLITAFVFFWALIFTVSCSFEMSPEGDGNMSNSSFRATSSGKFVLGYMDGQIAASATNANTYASSMSALAISSYYYITSQGVVTAAGSSITPSSVISTAHTNGLKVIPCISNCPDSWENSYAYGAAVTNKTTAINNIVSYVSSNNFDGAEIDFEYTGTSGAPSASQLTSFVSSLATSLHAANSNYILIVSVPPHTHWLASLYGYTGIAAAVNYMQVMTYDETGPGWSCPGYNNSVDPGPVAGYDWMNDELAYQINTLGISSNKILSGLPSYGQNYSTGEQVYWKNFSSTVSSHSGATIHRGLYGDTTTPWASWGTITYGTDSSASNPVLWYDDATSITAKAALVNTYNLAGTSVWAIGYEDASFWSAVNAGLGNSSAVSVSISPTSASITTGSTQQFTETVTGSSNTSVTWSVTGGGSVSSSGLFTAPSTAGSCTVKATSVADTTKSASAVVTVTASGSGTNIAPSGTGYIWTGGSSATSNSNKTAKTGVNDNNLTTSIVLKAAGEQSKWESAGVIWSSTKTVSSVVFINGADDGYGNGYWASGVDVQVSTNGTTWTSAGWTTSPSYPYSSSAYGQTYTFTGAVKSGIKGIRVVGKTGTSSWSGSVIEVQAIGY